MKFGKQIQKRQLEVPEYAASFVNYKALKKLIKKLSATPILPPQTDLRRAPGEPLDTQSALQANKATFFFQIDRELDKVNACYVQKEAELKIRLKTLLDKKKALRSRSGGTSRRSTKFTTLQEGFQQFVNDLNKLQQFVEINGTAFSKILKKWDKTAKSKTKELYLSRVVEKRPAFNPTVISELSDQATTSLQELGAWADGDNVSFETRPDHDHVVSTQHLLGTDEGDADTLLLDTVLSGNIDSLKDMLDRMKATAAPDGSADVSLAERVTRTFLASINEGSLEALKVLLDTGLVDIQSWDDINERNCLHQAAIYGNSFVLEYGLSKGVDAERTDAYGRVPLHYASMHGRLDMIDALLNASPKTINLIDHDNFTPLVHSIVRNHLECVGRLLERSARIDPVSDTDHVPLNLACQHGSVAIVELLLKHGAKILADAEGLYPQHLVARSGQTPEILVLLKQYGADLDQIDKLYGWTPLVHAASEGNVPCLQALLETGADPNILDEKDLPAMYYAAWEGHLECMKLLTPAKKEKAASELPPIHIGGALPPMASSTAPMPMSLTQLIPSPRSSYRPLSFPYAGTVTTFLTPKPLCRSALRKTANNLSYSSRTASIQPLALPSHPSHRTSSPRILFFPSKKTLGLRHSRSTILNPSLWTLRYSRRMAPRSLRRLLLYQISSVHCSAALASAACRYLTLGCAPLARSASTSKSSNPSAERRSRSRTLRRTGRPRASSTQTQAPSSPAPVCRATLSRSTSSTPRTGFLYSGPDGPLTAAVSTSPCPRLPSPSSRPSRQPPETESTSLSCPLTLSTK
ncbi:nuc-2 protein [Neurospora crassa OR74A]|uniref:nuc-2 protein n=1 Tax=Neurospora crassa (strain ATCC 24698 / 74-OR23-1A / CBS 708.71 / DSM 1257 / FGSC 987) TaxID=367110 RepID=UPI0003CA0CFF|nr:nuc-2 protein [Neurospora crassa OR74A]EDO64869.2 nuc-2 protein [Neurospora crassa OR74A]|eukprot:XP_001727960.2 nuc-2 protein [Neurospora crassa OR74A]